MKRTFKFIGKFFNILAKSIGYLLIAAVVFGSLYWFVWRPIKIAQYHTAAIKYHRFFGSIVTPEEKKPQLTHILLDNEAHNLIKKYPEVAEQLKTSMEQLQDDLKTNQRGWIE